MWNVGSFLPREVHPKLGGNECRQAVSQKYIGAQDTCRVEKIQCIAQPVPYMICTCPLLLTFKRNQHQARSQEK